MKVMYNRQSDTITFFMGQGKRGDTIQVDNDTRIYKDTEDNYLMVQIKHASKRITDPNTVDFELITRDTPPYAVIVIDEDDNNDE